MVQHLPNAAGDVNAADVRPALGERTKGFSARLAAIVRRLRPRSSMPRPRLYISPGIAAAVIPAHNEALVIVATLKSVLHVFHAEDVYVLCDNCSDATADIAREYLPAANVIEFQQQMGKSRGLEYAFAHHIYPRQYVYVSIVDADTTIEPQFLRESLKSLKNVDTACVVGQVKSRWYPNNPISIYRTYVYTIWQMVYKRLQSSTNSITIASGCSTTWKTRVLQQLDFDHQMSTEDFNLTIQVHRKGLGKIRYCSSAVVWTQDPFSLGAYRRQSYRWDRAWWESVRKYRIGLQWLRFKRGRPTGISALDISTLLLTVDLTMFLLGLFLLPAFIIHPLHVHLGPIEIQSRSAILYSLAFQYGSIIASALAVSLYTRHLRVLLYSPLYIFLTYVDLAVSLRAIVSTIRGQYRVAARPGGGTPSASIWISPERRVEA
ncbi:MAG: glycosyltransferase family 2 protein [Dehalococcoidia bacterium]